MNEITNRVSSLKMARYRPSRYHVGMDEEPREAALSALLQSGILKRLESCWYACLLTMKRILGAHHAFLDAWDQGHVLGPEALREAAGAELDETATAQWLEERLEEGHGSEFVGEYVPTFQDDVRHDRNLLAEIQERLEKLIPSKIPN